MGVPRQGPCAPWATSADVCSPCDQYSFDVALLDDALVMASGLLYMWSGRQFPGLCEDTVRPCTRARVPTSYTFYGDQDNTTRVVCSCRSADRCSCSTLPQIRLSSWPLSEVTQVKVDGVVLAPARYRIDDHRWLVRLDDADGTNPGWPCFPAGTTVLTSEGLRPIEEIQPGEMVLTHLGRWRRVLRSGKTGDSETVTVKGRGGSIRCTPDHKFWASEMYGRPGAWKLAAPDWARADQLLGSAWAMPAAVEGLPVPTPEGWDGDDSFWWMVGRWVGDGWRQKWTGRRGGGYSVYICCNKDEREMLSARLGASWRCTESRTTTRFRLASRSLHQWLGHHFGEGAEGKSLPAWILGAPINVRQAFLDGYVSADGWRAEPEGQTPFTSVHTVSRDLAIGLRLLVSSLGFAPMMYEGKQNTTHIENRKVSSRTPWRVDWNDTPPGGWRSQAWVDDLHVWGRVRSVTLDEEIVPVYDIEVEDDHSFIADGFVVHNCCQDMKLASTEDDTFEVTFVHGREAPEELGAVRAAAILACEIALACSPETASKCRLPKRTQSVARAGITINLIDPTEFLNLERGKPMRTGLPEVDMFLSAVNPYGQTAPAAVISPDIPPHSRRVGS